MMLRFGDHDLIALLQRKTLRRRSPAPKGRVAQRRGRQVQASRRAGRHDDFLLAFLGIGAGKSGDLRTGRIFERHGATGGQLMGSRDAHRR